MDSLKSLDEKLKENGGRNIYLFCADAKDSDARKWIDEMIAAGDVVEFLSGDVSKDARLIKNLIAQYKVSLIHTHFVTRQQFLAVRRAAKSKVSVIAHLHNHSVEMRNPLKRLIRRILYRNCHIVACSESVYASAVRDYPHNKKCYINNGVNFDRLDDYEVITNETYDIAPGEKVFLIFGFDYFRKGVDLAVSAMKKLREEGHNFSLLISLSKNFEEVNQNIEKVLGEVPQWIKVIKARNDVATLYNYVDLFLSPSREEGLPYSVVEAAYSKCSVVLSDISAQVNLRIKYGYWFTDGDVDGLAEAILQAEKEHEDKLTHMDKVQQYMRQQYALDAWSGQVLELYSKILEN